MSNYNPTIVKEVNGSNPFIRAYFYLWPIDPDRLNTCYLFWGTVLAPLNALVRLIIAPFYFAARPLARRVEAWEDSHPYRPRTTNWEAKKKRQARWHKTLDLAAPVWRVIRWPFAFLGAAGVVAGLYFIVRALVDNPTFTWQFFAVIGGAFTGMALVFGICYLIAESDTYVGRSIREFGRWVEAGYWAVKNRSCARFIVKK